MLSSEIIVDVTAIRQWSRIDIAYQAAVLNRGCILQRAAHHAVVDHEELKERSC